MNSVADSHIQLPSGKKIYFCSDFHLGSPNESVSRAREITIVQWLDSIRADAHLIFLVGDVFDFWFEYKSVVPKGYIRFLGKLAELSDSGIKLIFFTGNHDMWMRDYLAKELQAEVWRAPRTYSVHSGDTVKTFMVGHGDGLGPGDNFYKKLKVLFESGLARWTFRQLHPDVGMRIAQAWSRSSRSTNDHKGEDKFISEDKEWLFLYCKEVESVVHHDYYIFGHRHLPLDLAVGTRSRYINLGEWFSKNSFAWFDGMDVRLTAY